MSYDKFIGRVRGEIGEDTRDGVPEVLSTGGIIPADMPLASSLTTNRMATTTPATPAM